MYTVVIPVAADDYGVEDAVSFVASLPGPAAAVVVHVQRDIDVVGAEGGRVSIDHEELDVPDAVDRTVGALEANDLPVEREIRVGEPVEQIIAAATDHDAAQLVVPAQRRSPVGKVVFGSTTLDLVRKSPVPVTIVAE